MKEAITKFDLEAAFKALDDIEVPAAEKGIKANRPALTEIFSRKSKFDALMEEYYDISSSADLEDAQEAREAEIAKAKLERIEKIVDLDADSPEDLLTSYVGKHIIQCPQCMTLFYKDHEDIVESEEDTKVVNVNEICQHCGNEDGYTLIGKVGEAEPGEFEEPAVEEVPEEEVPTEVPEEEPAEDSAAEEEIDLEGLEDLDLDLEGTEEKTEESFSATGGEPLVEELSDDPELDDKLKAQNEYVEYLRAAINNEKEKLEKESNEQIKVAIQRNIDAFEADLTAALPDAVKNGGAIVSNDTTEISDDNTDVDAEDIDVESIEVQEESYNTSDGDALTESLKEEADLDVSADEFKELINSPEFKKPISSAEVRAIMNSAEEAEDEKYKKESLIEDTITNSSAEGPLLEAAITRAGKCDFVLNNGPERYNGFSVICLASTFTSKRKGQEGKLITEPLQDPVRAIHDKTVSAANYPKYSKKRYKDAEKIAKGLSLQRGVGPVLIFMNKHNGQGADYLCQYFKGALHKESDHLDAYIKEIKGAKLINKGVGSQKFVKLPASKVKEDQKIKTKDGIAEIFSKELTEPEGIIELGIKYEGDEDDEDKYIWLYVNPKYEFKVLKDSDDFESPADAEADSDAFESLAAVVADLEELKESALEPLISNLLVESYGNVAGFRLTDCNYSNNKFTIDGTIYFISGNTRKTTYIFTEGYKTSEGKIRLRGLNEKLGINKQFTLTGKIKNKTLITESFKRNK